MIAIKIAITVKIRWDGQDRGKIEFRLRKCEKIKIVKIRSKYRLSPSKTHNQYREELKAKNPDIKVLGIYAGANIEILDYHYTDDKMLFRCKECGNEWAGTYYNVIVSGKRCPNCIGRHISESLKRSHEEFVSQISKINPKITVLGEYKKATEKIEVQCNICNFIWSPVANSLIQGYGCPKCNRPHGEVEIGNYLDKNKIPYEAQKKFSELGRLSYDFYLPVQNLLIEFQGKQHYQPIKHFGGEEAFIKQQERDARKRKYAQEHNINLLEIKYNENINDVLEKYLYNLNSKSLETVTVV